MARRPKPKRGGRPERTPAFAGAPPELQVVLQGLLRIARESPEGWGIIAGVLKEQEEVEAEVLFPFLAQHVGRETLPLLRGAALDEEERLALGALQALPLLGTRAAGDALVEAYRAHPEGERGRLARDGIAALQAQGIRLELPEGPEERVPVPELRLRSTWETLPDGVGSRQITARVQDRYGVWHSIIVVWNDQAGVKDGFGEPMSRREWDEVREQSTADGIVTVEVPPDYARWQVARARALNARTGFPLPDVLEEWDRAVGAPPAEFTPPDPRGRVQALAADGRAELLEHMGCLMESPVLSSWALEPADCRPWLEEWSAIQRAPAATSEAEAAAEEALNALLGQVAQALVTEEARALLRERLLDLARKLAWLGWEHEAEVAAAALLELEELKPPGETAFFRFLADNGLAMLADTLELGEDPEQLRYDPMQPVE